MGFGFEDAMAEYEEAQAIVADFDEQAQASHAVASMEVEDEDGNVEIVSKNFKMKPTQKLAEQPSSEGDTWICWGCGQPTDQDICPVCGKKRTK